MKDLKFKARFVANSLKLRKGNSEVAARHKRLKKKYAKDPELAWIVDNVVVIGSNFDDPFRSSVMMNDELNAPLKTGLHRAVGGDHDYPNPGDILCAALATCMESTLRMLANRIEVTLTHTKVYVEAHADVRGTLMFDKSTPVAFQKMIMSVELGSKQISENILKTIFRAAKRSCVVYQTLKPGVEIENSLVIID